MIGDALVYILVMTAKQRELIAFRVSHGIRMRELTPAGGKQNDRSFRANCLDSFEKRTRLHDHSCAATVRIIVNGSVLVVRVLSQIDEIVLHTPRRGSARRNAQSER